MTSDRQCNAINNANKCVAYRTANEPRPTTIVATNASDSVRIHDASKAISVRRRSSSVFAFATTTYTINASDSEPRTQSVTYDQRKRFALATAQTITHIDHPLNRKCQRCQRPPSTTVKRRKHNAQCRQCEEPSTKRRTPTTNETMRIVLFGCSRLVFVNPIQSPFVVSFPSRVDMRDMRTNDEIR